MVTTQKNIVKAYKAVDKISSICLDLKLAYKFFRLKQILKKQYEFQTEREMSFVREFEGEVLAGGKVQCKTTEDARALSGKIEELENMEVDLGDFDKVQLPLNSELNLSMNDLEALDPFIEFIAVD